MTNRANLPPRYLRTPEDGRFLGLSGRTLEKHRSYGTGPFYRKLGGRVVYAAALALLLGFVSSGAVMAAPEDEVLATFERFVAAQTPTTKKPWQACCSIRRNSFGSRGGRLSGDVYRR